MWPFKPSIEKLKKRKDAPALISLISSTTDQSVAIAGIEALGEMGDGDIAGPLLDCIKRQRYASDGNTRWDMDMVADAVARALAGIGVSAAPALIGAIGHYDEMRYGTDAARKALILIGPAAEKPLIDALSHADIGTRIYAAQILGKVGSSASRGPLLASLNDVGDSAIEALQKLDAMDELCTAFKMVDRSHSSYERIRATVARLGTAAIEPVISVLDSNVPRKRFDAAWILGEIGDRRAIKPLLSCLGGGEEDLKGMACEALARIGTHYGDVPTLITVTKQGKNLALTMAIQGLGANADTLRPEERHEIGELLLGILASDRDGDGTPQRTAAVRTLGAIGYAEAIPTLNEIFNTKYQYEELREAAKLTLQRLNKDKTDTTEAISFKLECLICGHDMMTIESLVFLPIPDDVVECPSCHWIHTYSVSEQKMTLSSNAIPLGHNAVIEKTLYPIGKKGKEK